MKKAVKIMQKEALQIQGEENDDDNEEKTSSVEVHVNNQGNEDEDDDQGSSEDQEVGCDGEGNKNYFLDESEISFRHVLCISYNSTFDKACKQQIL